MDTPDIEVDYVIVGAGAAGMAFADELLESSESTMVIVDRRHAPGGHWIDAYPFVRLHGPSQHYGVNSRALGNGGIEAVGANRGLPERASAAAIREHFDAVMRERLLPSGRVRYLPMHDWHPHPRDPASGMAMSRVSGQGLRVEARSRLVDATRADTQVPSTHAPPFAIAPGALWVTPNELTALREPASGYTVVGGGKTAMDTVLWLLEQGVAPQSLRWVRPREAWLLNRADVQPSWGFFARTLAAQVRQVELAAEATGVDDFFLRMEAAGLMMRIDRQVRPEMFRCALVSEGELQALRRVANVVRAGHVLAIEPGRLVLERGVLRLPAGHVVVHCAANGIPQRPAEPAFQGPRLALHYVRRCAPSFSAALLARLEAAPLDDVRRNAMSHPVSLPTVPADWLRMQLQEVHNERAWRESPDLSDWLGRARLAGTSTLMARAARECTPEIADLLQRLRTVRESGLGNMRRMLEAATAPQTRGPEVVAGGAAAQAASRTEAITLR